jgi:hypothetical protein
MKRTPVEAEGIAAATTPSRRGFPLFRGRGNSSQALSFACSFFPPAKADRLVKNFLAFPVSLL